MCIQFTQRPLEGIGNPRTGISRGIQHVWVGNPVQSMFLTTESPLQAL